MREQGGIVKFSKAMTLMQILMLICIIFIEFLFNGHQITSLKYFAFDDSREMLIALTMGIYLILTFSLYLVDYNLRKLGHSKKIVKKVSINEKIIIIIFVLYLITLGFLVITI